eukprot:ctg_1755.g496
MITERRRQHPGDAEFFRLLALCHTVVPERDVDAHRIEYHASSPDEQALVMAAHRNGVTLLERTSRSILLGEDDQLARLSRSGRGSVPGVGTAVCRGQREAAGPQRGAGSAGRRAGAVAHPAGRQRHCGLSAARRARHAALALLRQHQSVDAHRRQAGDRHQHRSGGRPAQLGHGYRGDETGRCRRCGCAAGLHRGALALAGGGRRAVVPEGAGGGRRFVGFGAEFAAAPAPHSGERARALRDRLPHDPETEGGAGARHERGEPARGHAGHRRRRQRCGHDPGGARGRRTGRPRGHGGVAGERLLRRRVSLPETFAAGARSLVLQAQLQADRVHDLQERRHGRVLHLVRHHIGLFGVAVFRPVGAVDVQPVSDLDPDHRAGHAGPGGDCGVRALLPGDLSQRAAQHQRAAAGVPVLVCDRAMAVGGDVLSDVLCERRRAGGRRPDDGARHVRAGVFHGAGGGGAHSAGAVPVALDVVLGAAVLFQRHIVVLAGAGVLCAHLHRRPAPVADAVLGDDAAAE